MKAVLLPRGLLIVETVSRCSAATSVTEIALLDRRDPTTPSAAPGINALTRSGDRTIRANLAALQYRIPSASLDSFQAGCDNLTSVNSTTALLGKIIARLANKPFDQGKFLHVVICIVVSGELALPGPSPGPSCRARRVRRRP